MKRIKLAITGCMGRMGQQIIKSAKSNRNFTVTVLTENRLINKKINGMNITLNDEKAFKKADVIIDFTVPEASLYHAEAASEKGIPIVIGTTGINEKGFSKLKEFSKSISFSNNSVSTHLIFIFASLKIPA